MIKIIYGAKGTGKTKQIIDMANDSVANETGDIVFMTDNQRYSHGIKYQIRFSNTEDAEIRTEEALIGFIKGMLSANYDIKIMFIDGSARMIKKEIKDMGNFYKEIEKISDKNNVDFVFTVSAGREDLPEFLLKYID
ncbi:MAG: hypothetical protein ACOYIQ_03895 [Christensenellales bacterium]|jgi:thymidine kinase